MRLAVVCAAGLFSLALHAGEQPASPRWETFNQHCASCHGPDGSGYIGPAIIGAEAALASYGSAQGLLDYISATMPQSQPGSLSSQAYRELLTLLLIENSFVSPGWKPEGKDLSAIPLNK